MSEHETTACAVQATKALTLGPSPRMLRAALSGLMAAGAAGCSDGADRQSSQSAKQDLHDLTDEQLKAMCADMVAEAKQPAADTASEQHCDEPDLDMLCADRVKDAQRACEKPDTDKLCKDRVADAVKMCPEPAKPDAQLLCADMVKQAEAKASTPKTPDEKTISAEQQEYTFSELTKLCDDRGGYVQVHAACGGVNTCQGFSYGDWGPGAATLVEHTCTGVNGCRGLSCVVLPEDKRSDKSGADLYDLMFADTEPSSCTNCHVTRVDDKPQLDKFVVYVQAGSTRDESNWLDRSAAEQERVVAFGAHSVLPDAIAMQDMAAYNKVLSRKEIERLVAHIRTLSPVIKVIKTKDPAPSMPMPSTP